MFQEEQRGRTEGTQEDDGAAEHDGAQPAAVLRLPPVAQQVQDLRRAGSHLQQRLSLLPRRYYTCQADSAFFILAPLWGQDSSDVGTVSLTLSLTLVIYGGNCKADPRSACTATSLLSSLTTPLLHSFLSLIFVRDLLLCQMQKSIPCGA